MSVDTLDNFHLQISMINLSDLSFNDVIKTIISDYAGCFHSLAMTVFLISLLWWLMRWAITWA